MALLFTEFDIEEEIVPVEKESLYFPSEQAGCGIVILLVIKILERMDPISPMLTKPDIKKTTRRFGVIS